MATETFDLEGTFYWVRNNDLDKFGNWSVTHYPTPEAMKVIQKLKGEGLKKSIKRDEKGDFISWSRRPKTIIKDKEVIFGPPGVWEEDGVTPIKGIVGNGSKGSIRLEVYHYGRPVAKAARWEALKISDLVVYDPVKTPADSIVTKQERW